ncbi:unnamed protein product, partial [Prorocentrum cordatum]
SEVAEGAPAYAGEQCPDQFDDQRACPRGDACGMCHSTAETCNIFNYGVPEDALSGPFGLASLCKGVATLALRLGIVLAFLGLLGAGLCELEAVCPSAVSCAAGWGESAPCSPTSCTTFGWSWPGRPAAGRRWTPPRPAASRPCVLHWPFRRPSCCPPRGRRSWPDGCSSRPGSERAIRPTCTAEFVTC